jgi:hypothetical protein
MVRISPDPYGLPRGRIDPDRLIWRVSKQAEEWVRKSILEARRTRRVKLTRNTLQQPAASLPNLKCPICRKREI